MDFPHGHNHHQHHRRPDDNYPPPAPPSYYEDNNPYPPPPQVTHVHHSSHLGGGGGPVYPPPPPPFSADHYPPPPPQAYNNYSDYPPPPQVATVHHFSHQTEENQHHYRPHMPSFVHHHSHQSEMETPNRKPSVRVLTKAKPDFSLTVRDGKVILARSDPSDPYQHWIKEEKFSTRVKDEEGFPSFALINKATGQAIKHSIGATHPVRLIPFNPDVLDESILWTESKDLGDGYRAVRMVNNIRLNVDAFNGDKNHGGVHDGTTIVLWEWKKGDNQRWTIVPY